MASRDIEHLAEQERRLFAAMTSSILTSADALRAEWPALSKLLAASTPIVDEETRTAAIAALQFAQATVGGFNAFLDEWLVDVPGAWRWAGETA